MECMCSGMAGKGVDVKQVAKLDTTGLDRLTAQLEARAEKIIAAAAFEIEGQAKANILRPTSSHPKELVDTGALLNSIQAEKRGRLSWWIHDGVEYGIHWELGFHQMVFGKFQMMKISQHPFLIPAVEKVRAKFNTMWAELFK